MEAAPVATTSTTRSSEAVPSVKEHRQRISRMKGYLYERPIDIADALADPALSDCLLFDPYLLDHRLPHRGRPLAQSWEHEPQARSAQYSTMPPEGVPEKGSLKEAAAPPKSAVLYSVEVEVNEVEEEENSIDDDDDDDDYVQLPAAHIFLEEGQISKPALQRLVMRRVSTLGLPLQDAALHLPTLLASQPPSSPLRHLYIYPNVGPQDSSMWKLLVEASQSASSLVDGLAIEENGLEQMSTNKLTYLRVLRFQKDPRVLEAALTKNSGMKQLFIETQLEDTAAAAIAADCNLTRLDLRWEDNYSSAKQQLKPLLDSTSPITDLGLYVNPDDPAIMHLLLNSHLLARLRILRLVLIREEHQLLLAQALTKSNCNIQFLDLDLLKDLSNDFWRSLINSSALQALRIHPHHHLQVRGGLADYLRSPAASTLIWLECRASCFNTADPIPEEEEWHLANSLTNNFSMCTLSFPWENLVAKAQAASFIRRNLLYKSGQLLKEPMVKPNAVKLFVCGHGEVGKTTLCRRLLTQSVFTSSLLACGLLPKPARTRGMELHSLAFPDNLKLTVCDLGGQEEFHAFHHYFMTASNNDLFIVVCKLHDSLSHQDFMQQLDYWFRFIVSHRSVTDGSPGFKPKVIVVVNFFSHTSHSGMHEMAHSRAHSTMQNFSTALDFGNANGGHYPNLFGINATKMSQVYPLKRRLESLVQDFLRTAMPIPKLCHDIYAKVLPSLQEKRFCPRIFALGSRKPTMFLPYSAVLKGYSTLLSDKKLEENDPRVKAALMELHNEGVLVFFPKAEEKEADPGDMGNESRAQKDAGNDVMSTMVITDSNWFCNKLIGNLLATRLQGGPRLSCPWAWDKEDIKQMLRGHGCKEEHLEEILRYLQDLDLCFSMEGEADAKEKQFFLFPALVGVKEAHYPLVSDDSDGASIIFFGRRLRCEYSSMHLIPSGVFSRLQVKLHELCGNDSFDLGYGWASFVKGNVGVLVRFGGEAIEPAWETKQWIDILIFCPNSDPHTSSNRSMFAGEKLMEKIKILIYDICQADFAGIPTVVLKEWVLGSKEVCPPAVQLDSIIKKVKEEGLEGSYQEWPQAQSTPVVNLLLPKELGEHMSTQLAALASIEREYSFSVDDGGKQIEEGDSVALGANNKGKGKEQLESESSGACELTGQYQELWRRMSGKFRHQEQRFENISSALQMIREDVQMIREDIRSLREFIGQMERRIVNNCSTRLLRHELKKGRAHPVYPYLLDPKGKLRPLKNLFMKRAHVHFMCESPTQGPHPVQGQKGKKVTIQVREWLIKTARVMVPAFRVMCCLARLAATVYFPSAHVFIPSPDFLDSLGIEKDALQHVILPKAMEALLKEVPGIDYRHLLTQGGAMLQENAVTEAMQGIFKNETIDMATDFCLERVWFENASQTFWVCHDHIGNGQRLDPIANPFQ